MFEWVSLALAIGGVVAGGLGVYFGWSQKKEMRKQRALYQEKCATRYSDAGELVAGLTEHLFDACEVVRKDCVAKKAPCGTLSANVTAAMALSHQAIRFCRRLDFEYQSDFGAPADPELAHRLDLLACKCFGESMGLPNPAPVLVGLG
jgi:hypothetical protein